MVASALPLMPNTQLGPYEILAPLGAGGMGEVRRAHARRLEYRARATALLVLWPAELKK
jgi:hypothetical protein